jgi:hypothetical protein
VRRKATEKRGALWSMRVRVKCVEEGRIQGRGVWISVNSVEKGRPYGRPGERMRTQSPEKVYGR